MSRPGDAQCASARPLPPLPPHAAMSAQGTAFDAARPSAQDAAQASAQYRRQYRQPARACPRQDLPPSPIAPPRAARSRPRSHAQGRSRPTADPAHEAVPSRRRHGAADTTAAPVPAPLHAPPQPPSSAAALAAGQTPAPPPVHPHDTRPHHSAPASPRATHRRQDRQNPTDDRRDHHQGASTSPPHCRARRHMHRPSAPAPRHPDHEAR